MRQRCPESGKVTGLIDAPRRRVTCLICGRKVKLVEKGEHIVVGLHYRADRGGHPAPERLLQNRPGATWVSGS